MSTTRLDVIIGVRCLLHDPLDYYRNGALSLIRSQKQLHEAISRGSRTDHGHPMMTSFTIFEFLVATTAAYLVWAIVASDNLFHRIWSLALGFLEVSVLVLPHLWPSWSAFFLILFIVVDFIFCVTLSPFQRFIVPAAPQHQKTPSIEEVPPVGTEDVNLEDLPYLAELV